MNITRRALLGSTIAACALAGCTASEVAAISAAAVTYLGDITSGLTALSPALSTISAIPAATVTAIQGYFSQAVAIATGVNSAATEVAGASAVAKIEGYVNEGLKLLQPTRPRCRVPRRLCSPPCRSSCRCWRRPWAC